MPHAYRILAVFSFAPAAAGLTLALAGCGAPPPPPPPPTVVNLSVVAGPDINPSPSGQAAPVVLRVYQLGSSAGFGNAEFFPLYNADAATLGADIVKREDVQLVPGDKKTLTLSPTDPVKAVGFFAGLRAFQDATWRASADIPPHLTTNVTVTIDHSGLAVKTQTLPPPAPPKPAS